MSTTIIISICLLLLIAYFFDLTSSKTKVPTVIILLLLGYAVRQVADLFKIDLPMLGTILPGLGTIGLILIVLEGSLELEFNKSKFGIIGTTFFVAFVPLFLMAFILALIFSFVGDFPFRVSLINAIPLCVISSAIAIPSAVHFSSAQREFVIYETSLSDILGVILFNFVTYNDTFGIATFSGFAFEILIILVLTFIAAIGLAFLLKKIDHPIKFVPIIILVILLYNISKIYHLPGLVFILLFGLFLGNLDELKQFSLIRKLEPEILNREVHKFKEILAEGTFVVRALFFLVFGFLIETREIINTKTLVWAVGIVAGIFAIRALALFLMKMPLSPFVFIAPRGLITILLFFSIPISYSTSFVNKSLIIQVIALTALVMMVGVMNIRKQPPSTLPH